jgi:hypothetical protein
MSPVYQLILRIACVGALLDVLEMGVLRRELAPGGSWCWSILRQRWTGRSRWLRRAADGLFASPGIPAALLAFRAIALLAVGVAPVGTAPYAAALTVAFFGQVIAVVRRGGLAREAADGMLVLVFGGAWLATAIGRDALAAAAGLWFIAAQAAVAYVVAGVAKLAAPGWRSGTAMATILATQSYGNEALARIVQRWPWLARAASWAVMIWECSFPLILLLPRGARLPFLAAGVVFHLANAAVMGLHTFVWPFVATYPALWAVR